MPENPNNPGQGFNNFQARSNMRAGSGMRGMMQQPSVSSPIPGMTPAPGQPAQSDSQILNQMGSLTNPEASSRMPASAASSRVPSGMPTAASRSVSNPLPGMPTAASRGMDNSSPGMQRSPVQRAMGNPLAGMTPAPGAPSILPVTPTPTPQVPITPVPLQVPPTPVPPTAPPPAPAPLPTDAHAMSSSDDEAPPEEPAGNGASEGNSESSADTDVSGIIATNLDNINPNAVIWVVWILVICLIAVVIVFNNNKNDKKEVSSDTSSSEDASVGQFYPLPLVQTGSDMWTDYMNVSKTVQIQSANIQPLLTGYAENYQADVVIPVSLDKYNSISEGTRIAIHFKELQINGEPYISIVSWEVSRQ